MLWGPDFFSPVGRAKKVTFFFSEVLLLLLKKKEYYSGGVDIVIECIEYLTKSILKRQKPISVKSSGSYCFLTFQVKHFSVFWNKSIFFSFISNLFIQLNPIFGRGISFRTGPRDYWISDIKKSLIVQ
jgi:hypothetical protein